MIFFVEVMGTQDKIGRRKIKTIEICIVDNGLLQGWYKLLNNNPYLQGYKTPDPN